MKRITKFLSVFISVLLIFQSGFMFSTKASAESQTEVSLNLISESQDEVVLAVRLESGSFGAVSLKVSAANDKIGKCLSVEESDEFLMLQKEMKKGGDVFVSTYYLATGQYSATSTAAVYAGNDGLNLAIYTFSKNTIFHVQKSDFEISIPSVSDEEGNRFTPVVINNIGNTIVHDYVDTITEPTCTERGYTTHTCKICGDIYKDAYVNELNHNYVNGECIICGEKNVESMPVIKVESANAKPGDTIEIPVMLINNPGIIALMLEMTYDESCLELVSVEDKGLLGTGTKTFSRYITDNPYILSWEDGLAPNDYTESGTLVVLTFRVLNSAEDGITEIELSFNASSTYNFDLDDVEFEIVSGTVTIGEAQEEPPVPSYEIPTIAIGNYNAEPGDEIEVPVVMYNNPGIIALMLEMTYDESCLELISVGDTGLLGTGTKTFSRYITDNPYILSWEDGLAPNDYTESGTLVVLTFRVLDSAEDGITEIELSFDASSTYNFDLDDVEFEIVSGTVTIGEAQEEPPVPSYEIPTIAIGNYNAEPGDEIEVPVVMYNNPGIIALMLEMTYDESCLELISVGDTGLLGTGTKTFSRYITDNPYILSWEDGLAPNDYTESGTLVVLTFRVLDTAVNGNTDIKISLYDSSTYNFDLEDVAFEVVNGNVTVSGSEFDSARLVAQPGSGTVIDGQLIYGLQTALTKDNFENNFVSIIGNASIEYGSDATVLGTGSKLYLVRDKSDTYDAEYTIVIFGDVNGDGWYDGMDAMIVSCLANGMLTEDDVSEAEYMAADCNHDGVIDQLDVDILNQAGVLLAEVDQSKSEEELLTTSSAYVEYLNLIDQTVEEETTEVVSDEPVDLGYTFNFFDMIIDFIKEIITVIQNVMAFFK